MHLERQYLVNVILFRIDDLYTSEMIVKLKSNLYINIFIIFWCCANPPSTPINNECIFQPCIKDSFTYSVIEP